MTLILTARNLFDATGRGVIRDAAVCCEGDRITFVGAAKDVADVAGERLDLGDATLLPGFVDAHTHLSIRPGEGDQHGQLRRPLVAQALRAVPNLRAMIESGVTTARIMGEQGGIDFIFREQIAAGEILGPRIFVSGTALSATNGHGRALGVADGVDGVRVAVRTNLRDGADHVKFFMTGGVSSSGSGLYAYHYAREEVRAIVEEAHRAGRRVAVHAHGGPGVTICAEEGVDSIEHGGLLTEENVAVMAERGTDLVLTKTIGHHPDGIERGDGHRPEIIAKMRESRAMDAEVFARVRAYGLRFALGTDSMHGYFGYEITWLVEHGVAIDEALTAATRHGALVMGLEHEIGTLEVGKRADVIALAGDTLATARVGRSDVRLVIGGGRILHRA
jgi:imidazolonepropionase-like amidohydrolase